MHYPSLFTRRSFSILFLALLGTTACASTREYPVAEPSRSTDEYVASSSRALVVTSNPYATKAGVQMLKRGGNAVDAATAVSFALGVVRPQSTGIGGGGFMLFFEKSKGAVTAFDFRERAPKKATRTMFLDAKGEPKAFQFNGKTIPRASINGHLASGVPGLVKGILRIHSQHGKLPLDTVVAPAIQLAEKGFPIYKHLAQSITKRLDVLKIFPASRRIFLKKDLSPRLEGETLVQKDLAQTLRRIAKNGSSEFYQGTTARRIAAEMQRGGGLISLQDLKNYQFVKRKPVVGYYRGYKITSMPPPSSGGLHIVQMLNMLEPYDLRKLGLHTTASMHLITEVMRRAFADRAEFLGDPDFVKLPTKTLLSKKYARKRMASFKPGQAAQSAKLGAGKPVPYESDSTTHFSIVDKAGNAVSSTQTINGAFGSGVVAKGTGIVMNNEMDDFSIKPGVPNLFGLVGSEANAVAAGKAMLSSMSPTIVFDKEGNIDLIAGSPGGPRIINATLHTILNRIDYQLPMRQAVFAYRFHHQWLPDKLFIEPNGFPKEVVEGLKEKGHRISEKGPLGRVQAIGAQNGTWIGVADARGNGYAEGL